MEQEDILTVPLGIVFIATFWILLGTWVLTITSQYFSSSYSSNPFGIIPLMIGIGIILVGWGLLTLKRWAYLISLFFSVLGLLPLLIFIPTFLYSLLQGYYYYYGISSLFQFIFLLFIPMIVYLVKIGNMFSKKKEGKSDENLC
jgi:hypothetical protein